MRYRLRPLYTLGGYLAAACLCLICGLITAQILGRIVKAFRGVYGSLSHSPFGSRPPEDPAK